MTPDEIWRSIFLALQIEAPIAVMQSVPAADDVAQRLAELMEPKTLHLRPEGFWPLCAIAILEAGFEMPQDQLDVVQSIVNRLNHGGYGNRVADIIYANGQYEPMFGASRRISTLYGAAQFVARKRGTTEDVAMEELRRVARNLSDTAMMEEAAKHVGGRMHFKGTTMVRFRVAAEDPMRSPHSNFFHIEPRAETYEQLSKLEKQSPTRIILK